MEAHNERSADGSPIFDSLDIDLVVKVLVHTAFSTPIIVLVQITFHQFVPQGPFFTIFIPIFYVFQGAKVTDSVVVLSFAYYVFISVFCVSPSCLVTAVTLLIRYSGFAKWYSRLYRNQGSLLFGPGRFDWGEQIVVVTGGMSQFAYRSIYNSHTIGASGVGELLANTLAVRNVNVVVLDVKPIITENCESVSINTHLSRLKKGHLDNITFYKCDVSKWEEVETVAKRVVEEVSQIIKPLECLTHPIRIDRPSHSGRQQRRCCPRQITPGFESGRHTTVGCLNYYARLSLTLWVSEPLE